MRNKILVLAEDPKSAKVCSWDIEEKFKGRNAQVAWGGFKEMGSDPDDDVFEVYVIVPDYRKLAECDKKTRLYGRPPVRRIALLPSEAQMRIASLLVHKFTAVGKFSDDGRSAPPLAEKVREATPRYIRRLTVRETQVLLMIASGRSNKEIMDELGIAPSTLSTHIHTLYNKTGLESRCQLALFAISKKLVSH